MALHCIWHEWWLVVQPIEVVATIETKEEIKKFV